MIYITLSQERINTPFHLNISTLLLMKVIYKIHET